MISNSKNQLQQKQKILLVLLPFWTPLIPPMGISCIKSFLQQHGYDVKIADANVEKEFRDIYDNYFNTLITFIPADKRGNFYNIGIDVLQNHMTACFTHEDETEYIELIGKVIEETFFHTVDNSRVLELDKIITGFYELLKNYFTRLLETERPDVLGLSVYKGAFAASLFAFKFTRENYPHIMTVMGGGIFADQLARGSENFQLLLEKTPYIDKIIVGEGELLFLKLLRNELPPSQKVFTREDIGGEVLELYKAPLPDFSGLELGYYTQLASYTSRSCPFQCGFCAETVNWGKYRKKSAEQAARELHQLYKRHGTQLFLMSDSLLNPIITGLAKELVNSEIPLYWDGYIRADQETGLIENTMLWRRGGFYRARLGIETGSERLLELMDKRLTRQQIKSALFSLAHAGIKTSTYWVIGYPGETEEDFKETLHLLEELKENIYEAECNPFRYYLTGQVKSGEWAWAKKSRRLFTGKEADNLIIRTWVLDEPGPRREEIYQRVSRFVEHCRGIGIPNPYSWQDIHNADDRWKKLHANAVAPLIEFKNGTNPIYECKNVENLLLLRDAGGDEGDFDF